MSIRFLIHSFKRGRGGSTVYAAPSRAQDHLDYPMGTMVLFFFFFCENIKQCIQYLRGYTLSCFYLVSVFCVYLCPFFYCDDIHSTDIQGINTNRSKLLHATVFVFVDFLFFLHEERKRSTTTTLFVTTPPFQSTPISPLSLLFLFHSLLPRNALAFLLSWLSLVRRLICFFP